MRFKGTLILSLICILLLALALMLKKPEDKNAELVKYVFKLSEANIQRISITEGAQSVAALRTERGWKLEQPLPVAASQNEWNSLANAISMMEYENVLNEKESDPAQFGLDKPTAVVTFAEAKGQAHKVEFGSDTPVGSFSYAHKDNDSKIYLVRKFIRDKFKADLNSLRENAAAKFDLYTLRGVELRRGGENLRFTHQSGGWKLEAPVKAAADNNELENFLRQCADLKAAHHLDGEAMDNIKSAFGLPRYSLVLMSEKGESEKLEIGADSTFPDTIGEKLAYNPGRKEYFTLPATVSSLLDTPLGKLRTHRLADFYTFEVMGLTVSNGNGRQMLHKGKSGTWEWKNGNKVMELDKMKVEKYLDDIAALKVQKFIDQPKPLSAYSLDPPALKLILDLEGKPGVTLLFGREDKDGVYGANPEYPSVFLVDATTWKAIRFEPDKWRK